MQAARAGSPRTSVWEELRCCWLISRALLMGSRVLARGMCRLIRASCVVWYHIETTSWRIMIVKITSRGVSQEVVFQGSRGSGRGKRRNHNFHSRSWNKKGLEKTTQWPRFTMHYRGQADYKPLKVHLEQSVLWDRLGTACSCKPGRFSPCLRRKLPFGTCWQRCETLQSGLARVDGVLPADHLQAGSRRLLQKIQLPIILLVAKMHVIKIPREELIVPCHCCQQELP